MIQMDSPLKFHLETHQQEDLTAIAAGWDHTNIGIAGELRKEYIHDA
jgi:hypothetical protein